MSYSHRILGSLIERLEAKIDFSDGCWIWTAATNRRGYGVIGFDGKTHLAHRVLYSLLIGPIPEGLELDHTCEVHACVNPDHLEPITGAENKRRQAERRRLCRSRRHPWRQHRILRSGHWRCGECERLGLKARAER